MEKLKGAIEQYSRWKELETYIRRIEFDLETDFAACIEHVKSLLESIGKEICSKGGKEYEKTDNLGKILKYALQVLNISDGEAIKQIAGAIANIGQQLGNLRNEVGSTSHGKPLEELKKSKETINRVSLSFLLSSTELIACFLIELFETEFIRLQVKDSSTPLLTAHEDFNEYWDEIYGEFTMGAYSYTASEILYNVDIEAYKNELSTYSETNNDTDN